MSTFSPRQPGRLRAGLAIILALGAASIASAAEVAFTGPAEVGQLAAPPRNEASGLAASVRTPDILWTHDDSGGEAALYAVGADGKSRGKLRVTGVQNFDWEDIASGLLDGRPCLIIGDTGDNNTNRRNVSLHIVEEPAAEKLSPRGEVSAAPLATLHVFYGDGPHDCESIAFDAKERAVYLLTKRDEVPRLYRADLPAALKNGEVRAKFVGFVPRLPQPNSMQKLIKGHLGKHRGWPTGMDFAADGSAAVVVTYGDVAWFERRAGESWADALAREPVVLGAHLLPQAEAICFSRDAAHIFVASEAVRALLRYDRK